MRPVGKERSRKHLGNERSSVEAFRHILRSDPSLAELLSSGIQLVTSTGPGEPPEFKGRKFPTYFRLPKEPKKGLTKYCPINRSILVEFETDAANDYFERADSPGSISFQPRGFKATVEAVEWTGYAPGSLLSPKQKWVTIPR